MAYEVRIIRHEDAPRLGQLLCAWCLSEQGKPAGNGSHGICKAHASAMLFEWRKRRAK